MAMNSRGPEPAPGQKQTISSVDAQTLAYYQTAGQKLAHRYEGVGSSVAEYFHVAFPTGSRVLDVGAGSGRDLAALRAAGYESYGVEPSAQLREAAVLHHPELAQRLVEAALPDMTTQEALESAAVASLGGRFTLDQWAVRPNCAPHHTASAVAPVGGGSPPRPVELARG